MPIFNEQASIDPVIHTWFATLDSSVKDFILLAINDGSTDETQTTLSALRSKLDQRLEIINRPNCGHGQTCIEGYKLAIERNIPFILQIDSDGQCDPQYFLEFWRCRNDFDVIYGKRTRQDGYRRILASAILRNLLRLMANADCVDANVPYRLMNTATCEAAIRSIPSEIYLANIALSVQLKRDTTILHGSIPIGFPPRSGGEPSVPFMKFAGKALELFKQMKSAEMI